MISYLHKASEKDCAWNWAVAELDGERHAKYYLENGLPSQIECLVKSESRDQLTEQEWNTLIAVVNSTRSPMLQGLQRLGISWFMGAMPVPDLFELRVVNLTGFTALAPSTRLAEFVQRLEEGPPVPEVSKAFAQLYWKLRPIFTFERMRGSPFLVCETKEGPFTILEGYSRLSLITAKHMNHELTNKNVGVIIGVCPRLDEWHLWDDRRNIKLLPSKLN